MFYKMINHQRDKWFSSDECTVNEIINYIVSTGQMRDAQVEAIKTYLYLKISCSNKPLWELFSNGEFNTLDLDNLEISTKTRDVLRANPAALALYEYIKLANNTDEQMPSKLEELIKSDSDSIDYVNVFKNFFYGVTYTDYLYSLPMGAGKTYLMGAFIYIDLYFAQIEPNNKIFAHNFIVFAPSGLKSSVVPSLRSIQKFDPSWIFPEPAASDLKRLIKFEVLDQLKSDNKNNKIKNPNVQKIATHQPLDELMGLVAVTNAEKVIMQRVKVENGQLKLFEESDDEIDRQANELRNIIGKVPNLAIYIDEVHHVVDEEIKLRGIVNNWAVNNTINSVVGFSGTPYLSNTKNIKVTESFLYNSKDVSNVVYYYPLKKGINNFLKDPSVYVSSKTDNLEIVEAGVRNFLDNYIDKTYGNGLTAKLGIYCGKIESLEERVFPTVERIVSEYALDPNEVILKYHKGNKNYSLPVENELEFSSLDTPVSKKKIVLLVQIGKEGWDCRSLTGVILSQKGDCSTNMVLQTSCRCLRQVEKDSYETAVIWLNEFNAQKLNDQLEAQQRISLQEFSSITTKPQSELSRYSRMKHLKLPPIDFYQLEVEYETIITEEVMNQKKDILNAANESTKVISITKKQTIDGKVTDTTIDEEIGGGFSSFNYWLHDISKESFGFISMNMLVEHIEELKDIFIYITVMKQGIRYFSSKYNHEIIRENIRKSFYEKRSYISHAEVIPTSAKLLRVGSLSPQIKTSEPHKYFPNQKEVENIIKADKGINKIDKKTLKAIEALEASGNTDIANSLRSKTSIPDYADKTLHYIPYDFTGSGFEEKFLKEVVTIQYFKSNDLEIYYNGDRGHTDFNIKCFKSKNGKWIYIGKYTPDFIIIKRVDKKIHKAIIVETKGAGYANDQVFKDKREFMEYMFVKQNNDRFGYKRFDYIYLEDSLSESQRIEKTVSAITTFFKEEN